MLKCHQNQGILEGFERPSLYVPVTVVDSEYPHNTPEENEGPIEIEEECTIAVILLGIVSQLDFFVCAEIERYD